PGRTRTRLYSPHFPSQPTPSETERRRSFVLTTRGSDSAFHLDRRQGLGLFNLAFTIVLDADRDGLAIRGSHLIDAAQQHAGIGNHETEIGLRRAAEIAGDLVGRIAGRRLAPIRAGGRLHDVAADRHPRAAGAGSGRLLAE